jgi:acyl-CoA synthetase (NDP forming)
MLEARSAAVVGASVRPGSLGRQMVLELRRGGFSGPIYPVNPRYDAVEGIRCYPSLEALPSPVDVVLLGVANERQEEQARLAAAAEARSLVIFASLYDDDERTPTLKDRVAAVARDAGMAVCGGNCMGFLNVERGVWATGFAMPELEPGGISFISHSGSAFAAFAFNRRGLRFNLLASPGQELTTTAADYLGYAVGLESTRAVGLFLEEIRDPPRFGEALEAAARDVPVVALKVGRSGLSKRLVELHSRADAGEDAVYRAFFERHGVLRVRTLQEMADTLELLGARRWAAPGGLAAIHDSGGERALLVDLAEDHGVPLARLSPATEGRIQRALDPGLRADNPLDAWGTGLGQDEIFVECMHAFLSDSDVAGLAFAVDLTREDTPEEGYIRIAKEVFVATDKPVAVLSNLPSAIEPRDAASLRAAGIPVLEELEGGLEAFRHLLEYRDFRDRRPLHPPVPPTAGRRPRWRARLREGGPLGPSEVDALLADYGIPPVEPPSGAADAAIERPAMWIGIVHHPRFGPMVAAGRDAGGEGDDHARVAMPPLDERRSRALVSPLPEVEGGSSERRVVALTATLAALAAMAEDIGDCLEGLRLDDLSWEGDDLRVGGAALAARSTPPAGD